ncbi:MAG: S1/P1 nuclease [Pseudomonadota bacterium]|nr:S1/P1 nuclease [Pseudomonadota bacterium]
MAFSFSRYARCGFGLALVLFTAPAFAWGAQGHRLVGALAEAELTPAARAEVAKLLAGEPDPTLAGVANWADELRSTDRELARKSARWHFVNIGESGCHYEAARDCRGDDCVVEAIRKQAAILADPAQSTAARRDALKFVVHFVGDIHQPLHAGHAHDRGGNDFQVNDAGTGSNLHSLWDSRLFYRQRLSDEAYLARLQGLPIAVPLARPALPPVSAEWAEISCRYVLQDGFYPASAKLDDAYFQRWTPTAEIQLRRAGSQLATLLNAALPAR